MDNNQNTNDKSKNDSTDLFTVLKQNKRPISRIILLLIIGIFAVNIFAVARAFITSNSQETPNTNLILNLQPMGSLTTVEVKVAKLEAKATMGIGLNCRFSSTYLINGEIEAGISLTNISADDISYNPDAEVYKLTLPKPQLTYCDFTPEQYLTENSFCFRPTFDDLRDIAKYEASIEMIQDTLDSGILNRSEREATILIENLVNTLTGKSVQIDFIQPDIEPALPASCNPESPMGFGKNADGTWVGQ